jgi:exosortase/archaeosortase family protein
MTQKNNVRRPMLRFILLALIFITLLVMIFSMSFVQDALIYFTTVSLYRMLSIVGISVELTLPNLLQLSEGTRLRFSIIPDCTGIYPIAILSGFILAYPSAWAKKWLGILGAILSSFLVNYLRMISLIAIAAHSHSAFEVAHLLIWQTSFVILVLGYFLWWLRWK